jgi:hypothetical protein
MLLFCFCWATTLRQLPLKLSLFWPSFCITISTKLDVLSHRALVVQSMKLMISLVKCLLSIFF